MLFKDECYGLFIHWGIYSINAWHEQEQWRKSVPKEEYIKLAEKFNPQSFDADALVRFAKSCGIEYLCFTAKHHDGFCMWDTAYTDYNVMHTPYGKDILKEVADACEKHAMPLAIYYSNPDWHYKHALNFGGDHQLERPNEGDEPNEELYKAYIKNQMRELLTGYGKICALFWDIPPQGTDPTINAYVRSLQPDIFINDRGYDSGDYSTPERSVPEGSAFEKRTEACQSVGVQSWGYFEHEDYYSARFLMCCMDKMRCHGGNYLLNAGPDKDGQLSAQAKEIFESIGAWYACVKESYGTYIGYEKDRYMLTANGNCLYVHFNDAYLASGVHFPKLDVLPKSACVLGGQKLKASIELMPLSFVQGKKIKPSLHISGIEANQLTDAPVVLRLEFEDIDSVVALLKTEAQREVL